MRRSRQPLEPGLERGPQQGPLDVVIRGGELSQEQPVEHRQEHRRLEAR
jgi:hypothetical protein